MRDIGVRNSSTVIFNRDNFAYSVKIQKLDFVPYK